MDWNVYFIKLARLVATKSKDRSTKIGAVIVGQDHEILSTGFNGFPRGIDDTVESRHERPAKYQWTEHGERNAIYNAARVGASLRDATIYMNCGTPCVECARAIIQVGITRVVVDDEVYRRQLRDQRWLERWGDSVKLAEQMLEEAGVQIVSCNVNEG